MIEDLKNRLDHISFHTPGHNGGVFDSLDVRLDVTELSYTDNLLQPTGAIKKLEERWAEKFSADAALLFTNGATGAVFSAFHTIRGKVAFVGAVHASAFRAAALFSKAAVCLDDEIALADYIHDVSIGMAEPIAAVFVTSPSYQGMVRDLALLRVLANEAGAALIIDSAHGSHFAFCKYLPVKATEYGDLVIYSLHKTLPVLTGGAVLAVKKGYEERAVFARANTHTTSPSYLTLLSTEEALEKLQSSEEDYLQILQLLALFEKDLESTAFRVRRTDDKTRLVITSAYQAVAVLKALEEKNIFAEYGTENEVVFIVTPYNKQYLCYLKEVLLGISVLPTYEKPQDDLPRVARKELSFSQADSEVVPFDLAVGRVLNSLVGQYPPGVPLFVQGDKISAEMVEFFVKNRDLLFGLAKDGVNVVK